MKLIQWNNYLIIISKRILNVNRAISVWCEWLSVTVYVCLFVCQCSFSAILYICCVISVRGEGTNIFHLKRREKQRHFCIAHSNEFHTHFNWPTVISTDISKMPMNYGMSNSMDNKTWKKPLQTLSTISINSCR